MAYVDYKTLNPFSEIMPGIMAGAQLRGEEKQPSDAIMADPGEAKQIKMEDVTQDVQADIKKYYMLDQKLKSYKGAPFDKKQLLKQWANDPKVFQTPIVQGMVDAGMEPDEVVKTYKNIINQGEGYEQDLDLIKQASGGDTGKGAEFIKAKYFQGQKMQSELNVQRADALVTTLKSILEYKETPKQWTGKDDMLNPQTKKIVENELNYLNELKSIAPNRLAELVEHKNKLKGYKPTDYAFSRFDKKLGKYVNDSMTAGSIQEVKATGGQAVRPFSSSIGENIYSGSDLANQDLERAVKNLPSPPRGVKKPVLNPKKYPNEFKAFMKAAGNDPVKATEYAEAKGWVVEE